MARSKKLKDENKLSYSEIMLKRLFKGLQIEKK
jgi:hypothetical protein